MTNSPKEFSFSDMPSMFVFGLISRTLIFAFIAFLLVGWEVKAPASLVWQICTVAIAAGIYGRFFLLSQKKKYVALCVWAAAGFVAIWVIVSCLLWFKNVPSYFLFH